MAPEIISTDQAPAAIGPYCQARKVGNLLFMSGQIPLDPQTGEIVGDDVESQTRQVLANMKAVIDAAGAKVSQVTKTTVFMTDLSEFVKMNELYAEFFSEPFPARSTIQVAALPKGAKVEIEAIVLLDS